MKMKPKIYVAGPLNALAVDYIKNCHKMCTMAEAIRRRGFSVYTPCIDFMMGFLAGTYKYSDYFNNSQPWLLASDAVFFCAGWQQSNGCLREFKIAGENSIPTFEIISDIVRHFENEPLDAD